MVFSLLPEKENLSLCIDRTNWKLGQADINILMLGITYQGVAFPLLQSLPKKLACTIPLLAGTKEKKQNPPLTWLLGWQKYLIQPLVISSEKAKIKTYLETRRCLSD